MEWNGIEISFEGGKNKLVITSIKFLDAIKMITHDFMTNSFKIQDPVGLVKMV